MAGMAGLVLSLLFHIPTPPTEAVVESTAKVVGRERAVALWERAKRDGEGFAPFNSFSILSNLARQHPDSVESLVAPYLRFAMGRPLPGDRERYVRAVVLASGGDGALEDYLLRGCNLEGPSHLPPEWERRVDAALGMLLSYAVERSKPLSHFYNGPALDGPTYFFRGIVSSERVAWGSPPAVAVEVKALYPRMADFLLSLGDVAAYTASLALAYGRLRGSAPSARFILKHYMAGRFASLTEYAPTPYEPCLPESLYLSVARHPKVVGVMVAHSYVGGWPSSLTDSVVKYLKERTGKAVVPDWLNMGAVRAVYAMSSDTFFVDWLRSHTTRYDATPPYDVGKVWKPSDEAEDLWNSPALLTALFTHLLWRGEWRGQLEALFPYLEESSEYWSFVERVEQEVGWERLFRYAYRRAVEALLRMVEEDVAAREEELRSLGIPNP